MTRLYHYGCMDPQNILNSHNNHPHYHSPTHNLNNSRVSISPTIRLPLLTHPSLPTSKTAPSNHNTRGPNSKNLPSSLRGLKNNFRGLTPISNHTRNSHIHPWLCMTSYNIFETKSLYDYSSQQYIISLWPAFVYCSFTKLTVDIAPSIIKLTQEIMIKRTLPNKSLGQSMR